MSVLTWCSDSKIRDLWDLVPNCELSWFARTASRCRRAYILPQWFFFFSFFFFLFSSFFRRLISEVTKRISTKLGRIFTCDCYMKNLFRTSRAIYLHGLGQKPLYSYRRWTLTEHIYATEHFPYMPPPQKKNWANFRPETAENGWRVFAHPLNFCIGRHWRPYCVDVI